MATTGMQKLVLSATICLMVFGLGFTIAGVFSPAWQVVEFREFQAEHQHGLWWDCVREDRHVVAVGDFYDETPLHCIYKFDDSAINVLEDHVRSGWDEDAAAAEADHHRFWPWHKLLLSLIFISQVLVLVCICTAYCAPRFHPVTFLFTITLLIALIVSALADGVFFLTANRVDTRFVEGVVNTYEQRIGYAFYLHLAGTIFWFFAFMCSVATAYTFSRSQQRVPKSEAHSERNLVNISKDQQRPLLRSTIHNDRNGQWGGAPVPPPRVYRETSA
ncbi:clc-like domain-containing protein [Ditylenchus destructor]|uniref:Clc-like domain-containing protein n=1 Tax=Ditylenchus destructor TaxID=166010 RepID=A0AAD4NG39_9BILA|nr:clc-like domain-containing protein [Ditylenchus destructor]